MLVRPSLLPGLRTMISFRRLILEVHRRSLWQVLGIYVAAAWLAYQIVLAFYEGLGLPDWVPPVALLIFVVGLPIVLATAFVQEGTGPSGPDLTLLPESGYEARPFLLPRIFTWRNALIVPAFGLAFLGLGTAGYMGSRALGIGPAGTLMAKGVLQPRDALILADFEGHGADSLVALAVTEAFRTALLDARDVWLIEPERVGRVLTRMQKHPNSRLDLALAREVAVRDGHKAVIAGEVTALGGTFVVSARLLPAGTGQPLFSWRETARDSAELIGAVDAVARRLRERIGEPLREIRESEPLPEVTTASLPALAKYAEAVRRYRAGEGDRAIPLYEEALALDSTFALAYRALGVQIFNRGMRARGQQLITRAYQLRHRLTEQERLHVVAIYHTLVTGDENAAVEAYRTLVEDSDSTDVLALHNLGVLNENLQRYDITEELQRRALAVDSLRVPSYTGIMFAQVAQGKLPDAEATLAKLEETLPESGAVRNYAFLLALVRGDAEEAERHFHARVRSDFGELVPTLHPGPAGRLAGLRARQGRIGEAETYLRGAMAGWERQGRLPVAIVQASLLAVLESLIADRPLEGLSLLDSVLSRYPLDEMEAADAPYLLLATFYSLVQQPESARAALTAYETRVPAGTRGHVERTYQRTVGAVIMAEGRLDEAIAYLAPLTRVDCAWCGLPLLARAHDLAGHADSAIAVYSRYLSETSTSKPTWGLPHDHAAFGDFVWLAPMYERLADLHEQRGERDKAAHYLGLFVEQWKDADPELQPRVERARRTLERLLAEQ